MVSTSLDTLKFFSLVQDDIPLVEKCMREQSNGHHPDLDSALGYLLDAGGKRMRPALTLLVGRMFKADLGHLVTLASAVELLHTATLVHDDVIDGSLLRRGNPTLNASWSPGATILTGDFIFARAARLAAETESVRVMKLFSKTLATIVNGEISQMFTSKGLASRENYYQRIYAKTASLFELCSVAPVYLAQGSEEMEVKMKQFGYQMGMAFQIVDDILDYVSDQAELGKPVANDLRQGLVTLPAIYYHEENPDDPNMRKVIANQGGGDQIITPLVENIRNSGAIDSAIAEAKQFANRAMAALSSMPASEEQQALKEMTSFVVDRQI